MEQSIRNSDWYLDGSDLSRSDQKYIWDSLVTNTNGGGRKNVNVDVIGSVNGTRKRQKNDKETFDKHQAISKLRRCDHKTPPRLIADYLNVLFSEYGTLKSHCLYVAQVYTPKTINSVIAQMVKIHRRGDTNIQNPGKYFTKLIKFHPKKKRCRNTIGTYKHI